jgi:CheY-like chemotaxis protein/anti-sigma regulatory factor (Ser/Thr protein kinase)
LEQNFAQSARRKNLRFRFFFPAYRNLVVRTDVGLLQSVVMNLVSNAIKFTPRGGILISTRPRGDQVLLQVWDTGIGISATDIPHIYEEFHQLANPQRNREDGLGLGLSICQRAMALLGGEVVCRSTPGKGSVFAITLPLDPEQNETKKLHAACTETTHSNSTLLNCKRFVVVEDDVLVADGLISLLQGLGAKVRYFKNAEDALHCDDLLHTDLFIVDYSLGGELNGLEFLTSVQLKFSKPIRAVVCTGETSSQLIAKVSKSPWPVLFKPISYAKLLSAMFPGILNN